MAEAEGCWVTDVEGRRYLDMLAAYSALNFGHRHPELIAAAKEQLDRVTLTSRAFHNDQMGPFLRDLTELCGMDLALLMNSGAEAVETAIKTARKWGYEVKGVAPDRAKVIVAGGNFHGRTITIVSFSTDEGSSRNFGPLTPGFEVIPYGDAAALEAAIDDDTVAFLVEPIQGEAGVVVPPEGYLRRARELCTERNVLLVADEIQTGLGRTGTTFACEHDGVRPDVFILGKALAGGIVPLSAVVADEAILGVFKPGEHGSTFGGNPRRVRDRTSGRGDAPDRRVPGGVGAARRVPAFGAAGREPRDRRGDPRAWSVGRDPARRVRATGAAFGRAAARGGCPGEGHAGEHPPARAAARDLAGGARVGSRADPARARTRLGELTPAAARRSGEVVGARVASRALHLARG